MFEHEHISFIEYYQAIWFRCKVNTNTVLYNRIINPKQSPIGLKVLLVSSFWMSILMDYVHFSDDLYHNSDCCKSSRDSGFTLSPQDTPKLPLLLGHSSNTILSQRKLSVVGSKLFNQVHQKAKSSISRFCKVFVEFRITFSVFSNELIKE